MTTSKPKPESTANSPLAAFLLLALGFRLAGITWGLPNSLHLFSYHPDETVMLTTSCADLGGLNFFAGKFLPYYYNYGSLPFYLDYFAVTLGQSYHWIGPLIVGGEINAHNFARAFLAARLVSVVMGVGTVWATYALGRRIWGPKVGLTAMMLLTLTPLHVQQSHFATVDVGSALWIVLSMLWASKVVDTTTDLKHSMIAGVFAGLAAATKYSGALVILCVLVPLYVRVKREQLGKPYAFKCFAIGLTAAAVAFVIACPGCIFDTARFIHDVQFESDHVMHHGEIAFQDTGPGWWFIISRNLDAGMGLPLLLISLAGIGYAIYKHQPGDAMLAVFALPLFLILSTAQSRYARYEIPLLPILCIWTARGVSIFKTYIGHQTTFQSAARKCLLVIITIFTLAFPLTSTFGIVLPMMQTDPRDRAAIWLNKNVSANTPIAFGEQPWFWTPPINPFFAMPEAGVWKQITPPEIQARYIYNPNMALDPSTLTDYKPQIVVLSEYEYDDPLRLRQQNALQYIDILRRDYNPPIVFASEHRLGGRSSIDGLPTQDLPHDMLYPSPTVLIFTRRAD